MDVVHRFQPRQGEEGPGDEVDPTGAHFVLRAGPGAGIEDVDLHADFFADAVQQVGIGADQQLGVLWVAPQVGRVLGVSRGHQALALLGRQGEVGTSRLAISNGARKRRLYIMESQFWSLVGKTPAVSLHDHNAVLA